MDYQITLRTDSGITRDASRLQAAQALAVPHGGVAEISFTDRDGDEHDLISVDARHRAYGTTQPAQVSWASTSAEFTAADARAFAGAVTLAAEIAGLADEIARQAEAVKAA
jgi:hypothetical protein